MRPTGIFQSASENMNKYKLGADFNALQDSSFGCVLNIIPAAKQLYLAAVEYLKIIVLYHI